MSINRITESAAQNFLGGGGSENNMPLPNQKRFALWQASAPGFGGTVFNLVGDNVHETTGGGVTISNDPPTSTSGAGVESNNTAGQLTEFRGNAFVWPDRDTRFMATMLVATSPPHDADGHIFVGLSDLGDDVDPLSNGNGIYAFFMKVSAEGDWRDLIFVVSQGGAAAQYATGIKIVQDVRYSIQITIEKGFATLLIDGKAVAAVPNTITGSLAVPLAMFLYSKGTGVGGDCAFLTEYFYCENATP